MQWDGTEIEDESQLRQSCILLSITMRKNLPKPLDQLIFCKYTLILGKCSQIY